MIYLFFVLRGFVLKETKKKKIVRLKSKRTIKKKNKIDRIYLNKRIPVVYKGKPLTPCTIGRAYYLVNQDRAIFVKDKIFGWYLKLKKKNARTRKIPKISLGIDNGTMFTGYSVVSDSGKNYLNFEVENTLKFLDTNRIKQKTQEKLGYRRNRRSSLRHRPIRNTNRIGKKITYTSNYYYQQVRNFVERICRYYPISAIVIEDIRFHHAVDNPDYNKGKSFSNIEVNKMRLYNKLNTIAKLYISENNPKELRLYLPKDKRKKKYLKDEDYLDFKFKNKSSKHFFAHCLDSFCLACLPFKERFNFNSDMLYISRLKLDIDKNRRILRKLQKSQRKDKQKHLSKLRKIRVKIDDLTKSNHLKSWKYIYTERDQTCSQEYRKYGSSIYLSTKKERGYIEGQHKYFQEKLGYLYYQVIKICSSNVVRNIGLNFNNSEFNYSLTTLSKYKLHEYKES